MTANATRWSWLAIGATLVVLPVLPFTGAVTTGLPWRPYLEAWAIGLASVIALGLGVGFATKSLPRREWALPPVVARKAVPTAAVIVALAALWTILDVFAGNPHLVDEMAQLLHAKAFAAGRLAAPIPEPREAFLITHTGIAYEQWFSQYPPAFTAMLALGILVDAPWLVNPVLGGISVVLVFYVGRGLYGPRTGITAALLWAVAPWLMFMSGTYLNHVPATTCALAACALLWAPRTPRTLHYLGAGFATALVAANRPLDAVAIAVPMTLWVMMRRKWSVLAWLTAGGTPVLLGWGWFNWNLFGHPLSLGYDLLWGGEHGLGFHPDPWGESYTPFAALTNLTLAVQRLNVYLYEWPIPSLLPIGVWALAGKQRGRSDLVLATALVAAPALYFFYWHSGFYLGPRFYFAAAPFIAIATARAWWWAWRRAARAPATRVRGDIALATAGAAVIIWGWAGVVPDRVSVYRTGLASLKQHPERELAARGVRQAVVLVPESFGSRVLSQLWGLGVRPGAAERAYRRFDTCDLYQLMLAAREAQVPPDAIESRLLTEAIFKAPPPRLESWPDPSIRLRAGSTPPEVCQVELRRDLAGFSVYGYLPWRNAIGNESGIVFARDQFERNDELLERYQGWEVWRFTPPLGRPDTLAVLTKVRDAAPEQASR